jgi:hypothetical protein
VLLAVLVAVPIGLSPLALVLAVSVVVLHVLSTAIGTRLREHSAERRAWYEARYETPPPVVPSSVPSLDMAVWRSPLQGHDQPLRRMRLCLTAGAVLGGALGVVVLWFTVGERTTLAGILVGAASTAVVGAWIAFVAASAWSIFRQGWRDAVEERGDGDERARDMPRT